MNSTELKQSICNQILGTTFKDVEKAVEAILNERQLTPAQEEELELQTLAPQKFDLDLEFKVNKKASSKRLSGPIYRTYTLEEVNELVAASTAPYVPPTLPELSDYPTYSRERVQELMQQHYEYIEQEKKLKEERAKWDSLRTIEFETKIEHITKPSNSMKE